MSSFAFTCMCCYSRRKHTVHTRRCVYANKTQSKSYANVATISYAWLMRCCQFGMHTVHSIRPKNRNDFILCHFACSFCTNLYSYDRSRTEKCVREQFFFLLLLAMHRHFVTNIRQIFQCILLHRSMNA